MHSIEEARNDVQSAFDAALALALNRRRQRFSQFEGELWSLLLALGRALIQLFLTVQVHRPRLARYRHDDRIYELTFPGYPPGSLRRPHGREGRRAAALEGTAPVA